jgi:hypothetical protein
MLPPRQPRFLLTTARALAIITACYAGSAWGAWVLFAFVEHTRRIDDGRGTQVAEAFTAAMGACWLWSVVAIARARFCR